MAVNESRLREVMNFIRLHPERFNMNSWSNVGPCGTTFCLAGWTYLLATGRHWGLLSEEEISGVPEFAADWLGFDQRQAAILFFFTNVIEPAPGLPTGYRARQVTFADLATKVFTLTGIDVKDDERVCG